MKKIFFVLIVLLTSCYSNLRKESPQDLLKHKEEKDFSVACECKSVPKCREGEVLVCRKIELKEAEIIRVDEKEIEKIDLEFPLDKDFKRAVELNIGYLNKLPTEIKYTFADRIIDKNTLLLSSLKLKEIVEKSKDADEFKKAIIDNFDFYQLVRGTEQPTFSSYYEPIFDASFKKDKVYRFAIYKKPDDMIDVNLEDFDSDRYKGQRLTGRLLGTKMIPYYSREEIDFDGVLSGKGYEIAYLKDITDLLDLHTQGSGILRMREGGYKRARFAATNSLKFRGWMSVLLEKGYIERKGAIGEDKTFYDRAKEFINKNPDLWRQIISQNKRYVFFYLDDVKSFDEGPIGTYGSNLVAHRSVAIDNSIIPLGSLAFASLELPDIDENLNMKGFKPTKRFLFCHDTGGAIKGARIDYFAGTGEKAKKFAYSVWRKGNFYLLVIKKDKR